MSSLHGSYLALLILEQQVMFCRWCS